MASLYTFQELTDQINFRPLLLNKTGIDDILATDGFESIGFYVVTSKVKANKYPSITTIAYVLFGEDKKAFLKIDGKKVFISSKQLKEAGFKKNDNLTNTSFLILKKDLEDISAKLESYIFSYCVFGIEIISEGFYELFYEIIDSWKGGGGGPGPGVAVSPSN